MKFNEILPFLQKGAKVRRKAWKAGKYFTLVKQLKAHWEKYELDNCYTNISNEDMQADDWKLYTLKLVKLRDVTKEQYENWREGCPNRSCNTCPLHIFFGGCDPENDYCWIYHKDYLSDKFLDKTIEVETED